MVTPNQTQGVKVPKITINEDKNQRAHTLGVNPSDMTDLGRSWFITRTSDLTIHQSAKNVVTIPFRNDLPDVQTVRQHYNLDSSVEIIKNDSLQQYVITSDTNITDALAGIEDDTMVDYYIPVDRYRYDQDSVKEYLKITDNTIKVARYGDNWQITAPKGSFDNIISNPSIPALKNNSIDEVSKLYNVKADKITANGQQIIVPKNDGDTIASIATKFGVDPSDVGTSTKAMITLKKLIGHDLLHYNIDEVIHQYKKHSGFTVLRPELQAAPPIPPYYLHRRSAVFKRVRKLHPQESQLDLYNRFDINPNNDYDIISTPTEWLIFTSSGDTIIKNHPRKETFYEPYLGSSVPEYRVLMCGDRFMDYWEANKRWRHKLLSSAHPSFFYELGKMRTTSNGNEYASLSQWGVSEIGGLCIYSRASFDDFKNYSFADDAKQHNQVNITGDTGTDLSTYWWSPNGLYKAHRLFYINVGFDEVEHKGHRKENVFEAAGRLGVYLSDIMLVNGQWEVDLQDVTLEKYIYDKRYANPEITEYLLSAVLSDSSGLAFRHLNTARNYVNLTTALSYNHNFTNIGIYWNSTTDLALSGLSNNNYTVTSTNISQTGNYMLYQNNLTFANGQVVSFVCSSHEYAYKPEVTTASVFTINNAGSVSNTIEVAKDNTARELNNIAALYNAAGYFIAYYNETPDFRDYMSAEILDFSWGWVNDYANQQKHSVALNSSSYFNNPININGLSLLRNDLNDLYKSPLSFNVAPVSIAVWIDAPPGKGFTATLDKRQQLTPTDIKFKAVVKNPNTTYEGKVIESYSLLDTDQVGLNFVSVANKFHETNQQAQARLKCLNITEKDETTWNVHYDVVSGYTINHDATKQDAAFFAHEFQVPLSNVHNSGDGFDITFNLQTLDHARQDGIITVPKLNLTKDQVAQQFHVEPSKVTEGPNNTWHIVSATNVAIDYHGAKRIIIPATNELLTIESVRQRFHVAPDVIITKDHDNYIIHQDQPVSEQVAAGFSRDNIVYYLNNIFNSIDEIKSYYKITDPNVVIAQYANVWTVTAPISANLQLNEPYIQATQSMSEVQQQRKVKDTDISRSDIDYLVVPHKIGDNVTTVAQRFRVPAYDVTELNSYGFVSRVSLSGHSLLRNNIAMFMQQFNNNNAFANHIKHDLNREHEQPENSIRLEKSWLPHLTNMEDLAVAFKIPLVRVHDAGEAWILSLIPQVVFTTPKVEVKDKVDAQLATMVANFTHKLDGGIDVIQANALAIMNHYSADIDENDITAGTAPFKPLSDLGMGDIGEMVIINEHRSVVFSNRRIYPTDIAKWRRHDFDASGQTPDPNNPQPTDPVVILTYDNVLYLRLPNAHAGLETVNQAAKRLDVAVSELQSNGDNWQVVKNAPIEDAALLAERLSTQNFIIDKDDYHNRLHTVMLADTYGNVEHGFSNARIWLQYPTTHRWTNYYTGFADNIGYKIQADALAYLKTTTHLDINFRTDVTSHTYAGSHRGYSVYTMDVNLGSGAMNKLSFATTSLDQAFTLQANSAKVYMVKKKVHEFHYEEQPRQNNDPRKITRSRSLKSNPLIKIELR